MIVIWNSRRRQVKLSESDKTATVTVREIAEAYRAVYGMHNEQMQIACDMVLQGIPEMLSLAAEYGNGGDDDGDQDKEQQAGIPNEAESELVQGPPVVGGGDRDLEGPDPPF